MDQIPQPKNNQNENKSTLDIFPASSGFSAPQASPVLNSVSKFPANMNMQSDIQQFKLASNEVQGPKSPLVTGGNSRFMMIAAVLILIIIGVGGYYFYAKDSIFQWVTSPVIVVITPTPVAIPAADKNSDSDKDGLPDEIEKILGTYINNPDSDGDTFLDLAEIKNGYSPLIAGDVKFSPEEWDNIKGKIKIEDREFYEKEFETLAVSPSPSPMVSLAPSPTSSPVVSAKKCEFSEKIGEYIKQDIKSFPWDEKTGMSIEVGSYGTSKDISYDSQVAEVSIQSFSDQISAKKFFNEFVKNNYKDCVVDSINGLCFLKGDWEKKVSQIGIEFVWQEFEMLKSVIFIEKIENNSSISEEIMKGKMSIFISHFKDCNNK